MNVPGGGIRPKIFLCSTSEHIDNDRLCRMLLDTLVAKQPCGNYALIINSDWQCDIGPDPPVCEARRIQGGTYIIYFVGTGMSWEYVEWEWHSMLRRTARKLKATLEPQGKRNHDLLSFTSRSRYRSRDIL